MTYTNIKSNEIYTAQISPYNGKVYVEILHHNKETGFYSTSMKLWGCSLRKSFGSIFNSAPTKKNWIDAKKWANEQLDLIDKYGTVLIQRPKYINDVK